MYFWGDQWVGVDPFSLRFLTYIICLPLKIARFLISWFGWGSSLSFSFGFHRSLFDRKMIEVASILSLLDEFNLGSGEGMFVFGILILLRNFLVSPFGCWIPFLLASGSLMCSRGLISLRKLSSLSGKSYSTV